MEKLILNKNIVTLAFAVCMALPALAKAPNQLPGNWESKSKGLFKGKQPSVSLELFKDNRGRIVYADGSFVNIEYLYNDSLLWIVDHVVLEEYKYKLKNNKLSIIKSPKKASINASEFKKRLP